MSESGQHGNYRLTFIVLTVAVSVYGLQQSMVLPVLSVFQTHLHTSQSTTAWIVTAYLLSASVFTPIFGRVGDMYGKKRIFLVSLVFFAVGSILAALATSIGVMIVARVIQGLSGGMLPLAFGIIRDEFPRDKVAGAIGAISGLTAVATGVGLVIAGPIVDLLDYHWLFWFPVVVVTAGAIATYFVVPESPIRAPGRISWLAAILLSGWLVALLVGISKSTDWGWGSPKILALFAVSVIVCLAWIFVELRSEHPLIDMRMMRLRAIWTTNLLALLFGASFYVPLAFLPEFAQTPRSVGYGFGADITESGLILLPMTVIVFVGSSLSGRLSAKYSSRAVFAAGIAANVVAWGILTFNHDELWQVITSVSLLGVGFGLCFATMANIIIDAVPSHQVGVATGMNANIRTIGGSIGAAVAATIITAKLQPGGRPVESGYTHAFLMITLASVVALFVSYLLPRRAVARDARQQELAALSHPSFVLVPGGTLVGDESE